MAAIKICGITREEEIAYLNEAGVEYAGFVFYEKSRRYIPVAETERILKKLNQDIRKVAVTVAPSPELVREIEAAGFDILQVHGEAETALREAHIPLWLAANLKQPDEVKRWRPLLREEKVSGILFDAGDYGSGRTFGWESRAEDDPVKNAWREAVMEFRSEAQVAQVAFVLAGGLDAENVAEGIRLFTPDVVDVSSGVEEMKFASSVENPGSVGSGVENPGSVDSGMENPGSVGSGVEDPGAVSSGVENSGRTGKSREKIEAFVQAVRAQG